MILIAYGTRPEFIKIKPIIDGMIKNNLEFRTLFTGQHKDIIDNFKPDYQLQIPDLENRLNSVVASGLNFKFPKNTTHVLIQGDTSSVLSMGLSAYNNKIKIIHLEAGLRTYDFENPFPEEANRQMISRISDINLCPTQLNEQNLVDEKVSGKNYVVGNTVLDNLVDHKKDCEYTDKVLITMHRRENHDNMGYWFRKISEVARNNKDLEFIIPLHPNPNVQKEKTYLSSSNIKIVDPMNHKDLIELLVKTRMVITDSGGIQEECSFFNKKCLVCREITERPESVGKTSFMVNAPVDLPDLFEEHIKKYEVNEPCPYGDGHTTERIIDIFKKL